MTPGPAMTAVVERFRTGGGQLPGPWLQDVRSRAIREFAETGLPTQRSENWKYTNLGRLNRTSFDPLIDRPEINASDWSELFIDGAHRIVVVNGWYHSSNLSQLPDGVVLEPFSVAVEKRRMALETGDTSLTLLNTAFMRDGLVLVLPDGSDLDRPVQVIHILGDSGISVHPRTVVMAGRDSRATVVETFAGVEAGASWTNSVTEFHLERSARVMHVKRQGEAVSTYHTSLTTVHLGQDAAYSSVSLATGGALSRNETRVSCSGSGAECDIRGALLLHGRQHGDSTTWIDHRVPETSSRQLIRNVLSDASRSVFQGGISVHPDAQKTDASQSSRSLLLSEAARADTKPELRILADDVKCAHGATVGSLDKDALFYLLSRGIPPTEARTLLVEAFVGEVLEGAGPLRGYLDEAVAARMMS